MVPVEEAGVGGAGEELVVVEDGDEQVAVGDEAVDLRAGERRGQPPGRLRPRGRPGDDLGEHRVVVRADHRAVSTPLSTRTPSSAGHREAGHGAGRGR